MIRHVLLLKVYLQVPVETRRYPHFTGMYRYLSQVQVPARRYGYTRGKIPARVQVCVSVTQVPVQQVQVPVQVHS